MDFLDPKKQRAHKIQLWVGYILIAIAVLLGTTVLLYQAYGFGLHKGKVIQNGLIFVSSQPGSASIYLNGKLKDNTNARLVLEAGTYTMKLQRNGYRTWQRAVTVEGGKVEHFDYPLLIPNELKTTEVRKYSTAPALATQSPDRRWLLVSQPGKLDSFDSFDIKDPKNIKRTTVALPSGVLSASQGAQTLKLAEWSTDNRHVLLQHTFDGQTEYILLDQKDPSKSVNLTAKLKAPATKITLQDKAYDRYFLLNPATGALSTAKFDNEKPVTKQLLQHVISYKSYGKDVVLYATAQNAPAGEVNVMLHQDDRDYKLRTLPKDKQYLLNLTKYSGSWYVAAGVPSENKVYVYQDPVAVLHRHDKIALAPVDVLKVPHPNYVAFSANAQYIMAENGTHFAVYDAEYDKNYTYAMTAPFDKAQVHATWMDGNRLTYVSKGQTVIFDYDSTNLQTLMPSSAAYTPFFAQNYRYVYGLAPQAATAKTPAQTQLTSTSLLTPADL